MGRNRTLLRAASLALMVVACGPKAPPLTELTVEQLWERGTAAYQEGDWEDAIRYYDRFALVGGTDPRVNQAQYFAADAHFQRGEYITAATEFARLGSALGTSELAADARFMTCRAYDELSPRPQLDQEYTRAAIDHCTALLDYFPESEHADQAREITDRLWDKLARKVYEAGDWYYGRRAYDSALIYFEEVVRDYPATRWAPASLGRMVQIYDALEWEDEREETRERLLREYPESEAARGVQ